MTLRQSRISFPQELVDCIIDHCHGDIQHLRSLALVAKSWLVSARHHIFNTISVRENPFHPSNLSSVVELLKAGPSVCLSVRGFVISYTALTLPLLVSIIRQLPNLRLLSLNHTRILDDLPSDTPPPAQLPRGIETLRIYGSHVDENVLVIHQLIELFQFITGIELIGLWLEGRRPAGLSLIPSESPVPSSHESRKTRVDALTCYDNCNGQDRFLPTQSIVKLFDDASLLVLTVKLSRWFTQENDQARFLIAAASPNLRSLTIHLDPLSHTHRIRDPSKKNPSSRLIILHEA